MFFNARFFCYGWRNVQTLSDIVGVYFIVSSFYDLVILVEKYMKTNRPEPWISRNECFFDYELKEILIALNSALILSTLIVLVIKKIKWSFQHYSLIAWFIIAALYICFNVTYIMRQSIKVVDLLAAWKAGERINYKWKYNLITGIVLCLLLTMRHFFHFCGFNFMYNYYFYPESPAYIYQPHSSPADSDDSFRAEECGRQIKSCYRRERNARTFPIIDPVEVAVTAVPDTHENDLQEGTSQTTQPYPESSIPTFFPETVSTVSSVESKSSRTIVVEVHQEPRRGAAVDADEKVHSGLPSPEDGFTN
ncbi:hypothetical protein HELRODRAFT_193894 [Helobdella robusta]|uniref:Uncharacterized protein n=1 Tax=Helobdella robusta TaxID=6412 RepID=T1FVG4_HELRO|nr:hypothetical protein HELRODRAFT_193894 [Helobdella robusta]ESN93841.1 hypothetical protein HELRODRAFT_193894 [Helobdella robusta]